jgi:3-deoxy-D-manno-octulosonic-acid transferase
MLNDKASDFVKGRKHTFSELREFRTSIGTAKLIWIHSASLGEFEQGRPIIEKLKASRPDYKILLTFFSPSGYNIRKDYPYADHVCYLPVDTPGNARSFFAIVKPDLAIFVKYEFWHNHLSMLRENKVPFFLVSAIFRKDQVFFKPYGAFFRKMLTGFDHLFVQDESSLELLKGIGIDQCSVAGDTRVDRVSDIARSAKKIPEVEAFTSGLKILVAGSTWPKGEAVICPLINSKLPDDWKVIIAPHEITDSHLKELEQRLKIPAIRYSNLGGQSSENYKVLIIDNIGMLASLYKYGTLAYIGGGFGVGIHNILEPATFGLPVLFGPNHQKFREAVELKHRGGAFEIEDYSSFESTFTQLLDQDNYIKAQKAAKDYIDRNRGATDLIMKYLFTVFTAEKQA